MTVQVSSVYDAVDVESVLHREWLETNNLGGYASSSIINCHTRRYHGLLVAHLTNPQGKFVLVSKMMENLQIAEQAYPLTVNRFVDAFDNNAYQYWHAFHLDVMPTLCYHVAGFEIKKQILLLHGEDTVFVKYMFKPNKKLTESTVILQLSPLLAFRDYHALAQQNDYFSTQMTPCKQGYSIKPYEGLPRLYIQFDVPSHICKNPHWKQAFFYEKEAKRGYDCVEDLMCPASFAINVSECREFIVSYSLIEQQQQLHTVYNRELTRRHRVSARLCGNQLQQQLQKTAASFLVSKKNQLKSIIAGYHWFSEWGRDAMIALPGLTLYSGKEQECLSVLCYFNNHLSDGLIPNIIGKAEKQCAYNSVDASLWFIWAVQQYLAKTQNLSIVKQQFWSTLKKIIESYCQGTLHHIYQAENSLLMAGGQETNITWMDAMVDGVPVIDRYGAMVEVNALWYNAVCFANVLAVQFNDSIQAMLTPLSKQIKKQFQCTFNHPGCGLVDFVRANYQDISIRPNQIFAVSLPFSPLNKIKQKEVVSVVAEHLLTPYGLRTLAPESPGYHGCYEGGVNERDRAYHNGTVWPWLLGHFAQALIRVANKQQIISTLTPCLNALTQHMQEAGLGSISEIFNGDAPHHPNGCISQAWSVAELLRMSYLLDEVIRIR